MNIYKKIIYLAVGILLLAVLWFLLGKILAVDRGLDFTDEGLYLLEASANDKGTAWGFPFGWHTQPLYEIVGGNISQFRQLGALLLFIAGALFGYQAFAAHLSLNKSQFELQKSSTKIFLFLGAFVGGVGSLLYYAGLVRTPSYNWVNLFGIYVFGIGFLSILSNKALSGPRLAISKLLPSVVVASFGLLYSSLGKPTTPIFLIAFSFCASLLILPIKRTIFIFALIGISSIGWLIFAFASGWWSKDLYTILEGVLSNKKPALDNLQTLSGALKNFMGFPKHFLENFFTAGNKPLFLFLSGLLLAGLGFFCRRFTVACNLGALGLFALAALLIFQTFSPTPVYRWIFKEGTTACVLLMIGGLISAGLSVFSNKIPIKSLKNKYIIPLFIFVLPVIFGFGSGHGAYGQSSLAAGLLLVAVFIIWVAIFQKPRIQIALGTTIALLTILMTAVTLRDSWSSPYRMLPIQQNNTPVLIRGKSVLYLDAEKATLMQQMKSSLEQAGWSAGQPLLGFAWRWASTIPYFLEASVPNCSMTTIFYQDRGFDLAKFNIENRFGDFPAREAWILKDDDIQLKANKWHAPWDYGISDEKMRVSQVQQLIEFTMNHIGKKFPDDYVIAAKVGATEIWKPKILPLD